MYGLRKIRKDGKNDYNDFVWPLTVGAEVEASDWNQKPLCGSGLHCLPNAQGEWGLLKGEYWAVLEFDEKDMVQIDSAKCKVKKCKIVFLSKNPKGMLKFFDVSKLDSYTAYRWAKSIGNQEIMIDRITDSEYAYYWALYIGNRKIMINRVTDSQYAYYWALNIGNRKIMIDRVTDSEYSYWWAANIGNRDVMIDRVTDSEYSYWWALNIGNRDIMIDRVTDYFWAYYWARYIGNQEIMIARFPELKYRLAA